MQQRDHYFRAGDAGLRFRDEGAGAAVVFIHGWTLDLDAWEPQAAALAASFRVIRYDRRGFGLSEGTPGRAADTEDLGRLLDHLRLDAATIVGLSQGARVALAFALRQPERVAALVNALRVVGKRAEDIRVVMVGAGAAGVACTDILLAHGVADVVVCDSRGVIYRGRSHLDAERTALAERTNRDNRQGTADEAKRRLGIRSPDARRAAVVRLNSSALSESSG